VPALKDLISEFEVGDDALIAAEIDLKNLH
jgi:hypothetical protein